MLQQKIAVITPHQDPKRSKFLKRLEFYLSRQTRQPDAWILVDDKTGLEKDITLRLKLGIDRAMEAGCSVALVMEDDDWYSLQYIESMVSHWERSGKMDLFGIGYTYYYHIAVQKWTRLDHTGRASLMSTLLHLPAMYNVKWPDDTFSFVDIQLWKQLKGKTWDPELPLCVGIKHGVGNTGGTGHKRDWSSYKQDLNWSVLRKLIGADSEFYEQYFL